MPLNEERQVIDEQEDEVSNSHTMCDVESHIFYIYLSIINCYSEIIVIINYV